MELKIKVVNKGVLFNYQKIENQNCTFVKQFLVLKICKWNHSKPFKQLSKRGQTRNTMLSFIQNPGTQRMCCVKKIADKIL